jgi:hypothetical protein
VPSRFIHGRRKLCVEAAEPVALRQPGGGLVRFSVTCGKSIPPPGAAVVRYQALARRKCTLQRVAVRAFGQEEDLGEGAMQRGRPVDA